MTHIQELNKTVAGKAIFKALADKQRARRRTDLGRLYRSLSKEVSYEEFRSTFKKLQDAGMGSLIIGRKNNPDRFEWNYSLREVAKAAQQKSSTLAEVLPVKTVKKDVVHVSPNINIQFTISANTPRTEIEALLDLAKDLAAK